MSNFTKLEHAVLTSICEEHGANGEALRTILLTAWITERKNTGNGFFTSFDVNRSYPPLLFPERLVGGPNAEVKIRDQEAFMGFILWLENEYPSCLEGFQYCTKSGEKWSGEKIDLHREDLSAMQLLNITNSNELPRLSPMPSQR